MSSSLLQKNQKLNMRYRIIRSIGQGGFGITYVAEDEVLHQHVVIKEYFPIMLVSREADGEIVLSETESDKQRYQEGMNRFLNEAKVLASLFEITGIVKVLDYFQENKTAYIVMEHVKGTSLRNYLENMGEELSFEKTCEMLKPVMISLEKVHQKGLLHRDISPDNLMVEEDGKIKMLDFGSAREYFLEQDREKTLTILVKNGYAPPEQYESKGGQGPWTDVYALCATMYEMMTGCMPSNSKEREISDELYAPSTYGVEITPEQEEAFLSKGLALVQKDRYKNMRELMEDFFPEEREKKEKQNSKKKLVIGITSGIFLIAAIVFGLYFYMKPQEEIVRYAGSFVRDSEEYKDFMEFVKENAASQEVSTDRNGFEVTLYTLEEETVKEIDLPSNVNVLEATEGELITRLQERGYELKSAGSGKSFEVEEGAYGVIKTSFLVQDNYETSDGVQLEVRYEYFTKKITFIRISIKNGMDADYSQMAADTMEIMVPAMEGEAKAEDIREGKKFFEEADDGDNGYVYGWELREFTARFLWRDGVDEATICFFPYGISYTAPAYKW